MEKKIGLKQEVKTSRGKRHYANPQATLINHPTRLKIIETLQTGEKTTRELEKITGENRMNLYYHLNLLENEKLISVKYKGKEKVFQSRQSTFIDSSPITTIVIQIPEGKQKDLFFNRLGELLSVSPRMIPKISIEDLKGKSYSTLNLQLLS